MLLPALGGSPFANGGADYPFDYQQGATYRGPIWPSSSATASMAGGAASGLAGGYNLQGIHLLSSSGGHVPLHPLMDKVGLALIEISAHFEFGNSSAPAQLVSCAGGWQRHGMFTGYFKARNPGTLRYADEMFWAGLISGSSSSSLMHIGSTERQFVLDGQDFHFFTHNVSYQSKDNVNNPSDLSGQLTFTFVPADESAAALTQPQQSVSFRSATDADEFAIHVHDFLEGTVYIHMGRATVADVQDYIVQDLLRVTAVEDAPRLHALLTQSASVVSAGAVAHLVTPEMFSGVTNFTGLAVQDMALISKRGYGLFNGVVEGIVSIMGVPSSRLVRIYNQSNGEFVDSQWSGPDGSYRFENLQPATEYFVISHDYQRTYTAVAKDRIQL